ncbi:retrovirus-related pol polyprotein from transposon TNT 1-94 [Tanacetum coccineum]|uniref:Retrovirus-related pol polyprotein from transposon TNT 1-94 n=1 Tax=Tanacetum coccineum TaxID=301880 RepID=A0ABQ5C0N2_9ASTR
MECALSVNQQSEFSQPDSGLIIPVFQKGDDPIDAINHMMYFLTDVVTSYYPTTNNQLRNLSNPRQHATINNGRVTLQPIQERQTSLATGDSRTYTPGASGSNHGKQRTIICYNCKREGHMSKQCTKPKRKRDDSWFKDKVLLVQAQASSQILHEEELAFLADPGIPEVALMENLSHYDLDALAEVHNPNNVNNNLINQAVQEMPSSEQSNVAAVQNSNSSTQQDALILFVIEQLKTQVVNYTKINLENKSVNDILTAELERYKDQVKVLKEGQNVDLKSKDNVSDSCFQNPFYLKKAQQLELKLYVGDIIEKTNPIVISDSEETLILAEESRSKILLKQQDPMMLEKKVNTTPVDYANSVNSPEPTLSSRPTKVEVPKELPKVSMVNMSLKKLKYHLAGFDMVVKERTTLTTIIEGSWGFEHTKACFRDEIIPFVKALKDLFNIFNQYLVHELSEVQNVFHQMEQAVKQHRFESKTFEVKMNQVLNENERLLEQVLSKDIVNIIVNSSVHIVYVNVHECEKCLKLETERLNKKDFIEKEIYDKLFKSFTTLEKNCISSEVDSQLNQEIFQRENPVSNQSAPCFDQLFELNELKAQSQEKYTVIKKLKERIKALSGKKNKDMIKQELEEIKTINIELDHREEAVVLRDPVDHIKAIYPLDQTLDSARSASGSQPSGNTKKDKILQSSSSTLNNKVEAHSRTAKTSLKNKNNIIEPKGNANVKHSKLNANSKPLCAKCNGCILSDNHDLCVLDFINNVNARNKSKSVKKNSKKKVWKPTGKIGIVMISRVYNVEGLEHNLFSVGQFCDSNLEVSFRQHACFIRNLEGVDLLTGSRGNNLYTLSLGDMMASSPICLLSKASKTNKKKPHKPKSEDTNQEKLYLLHMDLCGPMRVASINGKKYILGIIDDYSRFIWVKFLRLKDEAPYFIIKFLKMIQVRLKVTVRRIRTNNGTEFVNQTLCEYYEKVGISHETSIARSP